MANRIIGNCGAPDLAAADGSRTGLPEGQSRREDHQRIDLRRLNSGPPSPDSIDWSTPIPQPPRPDTAGRRAAGPGAGCPGPTVLLAARDGKVSAPPRRPQSTAMGQRHSGPMAGRTVLVTGASGRIGTATALGLARMGADLAICGRDPENTQDAARELSAADGGPVEVVVADLPAQFPVPVAHTGRGTDNRRHRARRSQAQHSWMNSPAGTAHPSRAPSGHVRRYLLSGSALRPGPVGARPISNRSPGSCTDVLALVSHSVRDLQTIPLGAARQP